MSACDPKRTSGRRLALWSVQTAGGGIVVSVQQSRMHGPGRLSIGTLKPMGKAANCVVCGALYLQPEVLSGVHMVCSSRSSTTVNTALMAAQGRSRYRRKLIDR